MSIVDFREARMRLERATVSFALGLLLTGRLSAQTPDVDAIMFQVAEHQDEAEQMRTKYIYTQKVRIRALRANGRLSREEYCVYNAVPTDKATKKELVQFKARYEN